ncbi:hypothetical protein F5Y12DRAFT_780642 [Xylaria sp. FL1777]|nr:hypothetical protein F5Y12DRAFT_780642 [Xylaria sp. FL1777]
MAPSSKGTNPAPNYTEAMNRVQTQIEARLRIVRSFMPSRAAPPQNPPPSSSVPGKPTPSFSTLASTSTSKASLPSSSSNSVPRQRAQTQDEDNLFTETRAQDPNAGLGFGAPSKRASEREKERSNQMLRSRLLGRKRGAEDASGRTLRRGGRDESSDEEAGRSGLGRAKKRARREVSREEEGREEEEEPGNEEITRSIVGSEALEPELERAGATQSRDDKLRNGEIGGEEEENEGVDVTSAQGITFSQDELVADVEGGTSEQKIKKRRKRKKKKKVKTTKVEGE